MTNGEKFKEVFGYELTEQELCAMPVDFICPFPSDPCTECNYFGWTDQEYIEQGEAQDLKAAKEKMQRKLKEIERDRNYRPHDSNFWEGFYMVEEVFYECFGNTEGK